MNRKSTNFVYSAKGFEKSNCDEKAVEYDQLEYMLKKEKSLNKQLLDDNTRLRREETAKNM